MRRTRFSTLAFNASNQLAVRRNAAGYDLTTDEADPAQAAADLAARFPAHTPPGEYFTVDVAGDSHRVSIVQVDADAAAGIEFRPIEELERDPSRLSPRLAAILDGLEPYLIDVPYLHLGENDFIYKFRPEQERNPAIYGQDAAASSLYQSRLFAALKALVRQRERTATAPVTLDFGAIHYIIPSHFGFCLGVRNAIERAYETLAENPGKRVYMLSELIHNPFVNEDLIRRGLAYLQTDKGVPYAIDGRPATEAPEAPLLWDRLTPDDIVIVPAFGATDDDKRRLVRKGIAIYPYDATCMLVEKVWKAARAYGREGYTVVIHGKHEHEETKATFSNTRRHAPAVIVRNLEETRLLGEIIASRDPAVRARFYTIFAGKHTPGFDVDRHLQHIAVVNQTTLLMNETQGIIAYLRALYGQTFGPAPVGGRAWVGGGGRTDTLCYATQVNQDALARALTETLDAAFVVGGKNSSNTYQLYRLCDERLGRRAFFIQSESAIRSSNDIEHYVFPAKTPGGTHVGYAEKRPLWAMPNFSSPKRILITGGASCPDGIIQQVITRLNSLFPPEKLRSVEDVLKDLERA